MQEIPESEDLDFETFDLPSNDYLSDAEESDPSVLKHILGERTGKLDQFLKAKQAWLDTINDTICSSDASNSNSEEKEAWETITVPEPFSFTSKKFVKKQLDYTGHENQFVPKPPFRAREVPLSTLKPLYEEIINNNKLRRALMKQQCVQKTLQDQRPFSFYKKQETDREVQTAEEFIPIPFKANEVPAHVKKDLYEHMKKFEKHERERRLKERSEKLLKESRLPKALRKRMAESEKKKKKLVEQFPKPKKAKSIPNFQRLHRKLKSDLLERKIQRPTTKPIPFNFTDPPPIKIYQGEVVEKETTVVKAKVLRKSKPRKEIKSTKKFDQAVIKRKNEAKEKNLATKLKRKERKSKKKRVRKKWSCILDPFIVDNADELKKKREHLLADAKEGMREQAKSWKKFKKDMYKRIWNRPLLIEGNTRSLKRAEARKLALMEIKSNMQSSGITDFRGVFDQQELEDLGIS